MVGQGIEREVDYSYTELLQQNEQSLSFSACLEDGEARAAYKNTSFDVRTYDAAYYLYINSEDDDLLLDYGNMNIGVSLRCIKD